MARSNERLRRGSLGTVKSVLEKLHNRLLNPRVGHFVVVATGGWQPRRFLVDIDCLNDPEFLKLLNQAEEEFGFSQEGALAIPCQPDELQRISGVRAGEI